MRTVLGDRMARRRDNRRSISSPVNVQRYVVVRRVVPSPVTLVEDRRFYNPLGSYAPARSLNRRSRLVIVSPNVNKSRPVSSFRVPSAIGFDVPSRVAVCVRRKQRKEVLHALKFTGKGSGGGKHRRTYWSGVSCSGS